MCCSNLSADFKVKFYSFSRIKRQHNEIHNTRTATKVLHKITASRTIIAHFTVMDNLIYIIMQEGWYQNKVTLNPAFTITVSFNDLFNLLLTAF